MKLSLAAQIEEVEREIALRKGVYPRQVSSGKMRQSIADMHLQRMDAVLATLQWLQLHEERIKAKIEEPPPQLAATESARVYTQRGAMMLDYAKGGWEHRFEICDDTGALIGFKHVVAETRASGPQTYFVPFGARTFKTAKEFIAAYERGEWKPRQQTEAA